MFGADGYHVSSESNANLGGRKDTTDSETHWLISVDDTGTATLKSVKIGNESGERCISYKPADNIFKNYLTNLVEDQDNSNYLPLTLYRRVESEPGTIAIKAASNGLGTFYSEKAFIVPNGMEAGIVTVVDGTTLTPDYRWQAGATVPTGTPVIVRAENVGDYEIRYTDTTLPEPANNRLYGADDTDASGQMYVAGADKYYILSRGSHGVGFYYAATDGAATTYQQGRAFLALSNNEAFAASFALVGGLTDIPSVIRPTENADAIYTLSGIRVEKNKCLSPGIYIKDGKKFIIK